MNLGTAQALIGAAMATPTVELELAHADPKRIASRSELQQKLGDAYKVIDWCELDQQFLVCDVAAERGVTTRRRPADRRPS